MVSSIIGFDMNKVIEVFDEVDRVMQKAYSPRTASYHFGIPLDKIKEIMRTLPRFKTNLIGMWIEKKILETEIKKRNICTK